MKKKFKSRWDKLGNARIVATAFQTSDEGNRLTLLLQAREMLIKAKTQALELNELARLGNAIDYSLILSESALNSEAAQDILKNAQDAIMLGQHGRKFTDQEIASIDAGLDLLEQQFSLHTPIEIGKARQEWWNRVNRGLVLESIPL